MKYKLQILGGLYSAVDVLEELATRQANNLIIKHEARLSNAGFETVEDGRVIASVDVEVDGEITDADLDEMATQYLGIGFKVEKVDA